MSVPQEKNTLCLEIIATFLSLSMLLNKGIIILSDDYRKSDQIRGDIFAKKSCFELYSY